MVFSESLLHFIWQYRLFDQLNLQTEVGDFLQVIDVGQYNRNAGPDFEFARIQIGDALWSGHVEIHIKEDDWIAHHHHEDIRYDSTILHVVWELSVNKSIERTDGSKIPTLELRKYVDATLLERYHLLMNNLDWIPCVNQISTVRDVTIEVCLSRMVVERLEQKFKTIDKQLERTKQDWELVFLHVLGRSFGMKVNAEAFKNLCLRLDLQLIHKYKADATKIESLVFGLAGFLNHADDEYAETLQKEYLYLRHLHGLEEMNVEEWRFMRMRPYNFPTFRLAQFAALLVNRSYWFAYIREIEDLQELFDYIDQSQINQYWATHYRFGKGTESHSTAWSAAFKHHLVINCIVPMLFAYGSYMKEEKYKDKALDWLNGLPAEVNQITKAFASHTVKCNNAGDSQALLNLKSQYCDRKQCLSCAIGLEILKA